MNQLFEFPEQYFQDLKSEQDFDVPPQYAAVTFLILRYDNDPYAVFTRRSTQLKNHSGQVSFAGGKNDPEDSSIVQTGLRELEEELGIPPSDCKVVGVFPPHRSINQLTVFPLLVFSEYKPVHELVVNEAEVDQVFYVPLAELNAEHAQTFSFTMFGHRRTSVHYDTTQVPIWGLTAQIIRKAFKLT